MAKNDVNEVQLTSLDQICGQKSAKDMLKTAVDSYKFQVASGDTNAAFFNTLLSGPPGTGKSLTINTLAKMLNVGFHEVMSQSVKTQPEMNYLLLKCKDGDILFFEECQLLNKEFQTLLLYCIDKSALTVQSGRRLINMPLARICYMFATTNPEAMLKPLVDRCRIVVHFSLYDNTELEQIVSERCQSLQWRVDQQVPKEIAVRSRNTPRIALRLLQQARMVALSERSTAIRLRHAQKAFQLAEVDCLGLDKMESRYLNLLKNGPLKLNVLTSLLGALDQRIVSQTIEPYLIRLELITKCNNSERCITQKGLEHLSKGA